MLFAALLLSTSALATPADQIRALPNDGDWSPAVKVVLLASYDTDGSGTIDVESETRALDCDTWRALDDAVRDAWNDNGMFVVYGFDPDKKWVAWSWGIDPSQRTIARQAAAACGISNEPGPASRQTTPADTAATVERLRAAEDSETTEWTTEAPKILVGTFDTDGDGVIDTLSELGAIDCDVWSALDSGSHAVWDAGIRSIYGLDPEMRWAGASLGLAENMRAAARVAAAACRIGPRITDPTPVIEGLPEPGSDPWDDFVWRALVVAYDEDTTGQLDDVREIDAISCETWTAIDGGVRSRWGGGLLTVYNFEAAGDWFGGQLGISRGMRAASFEAARRCGLKVDRGADGPEEALPSWTPTGATPAARIASIAGAPNWDELVRAELVGAYDLSRNNQVDTAKEIKAIPCTVWASMELHVGELYGGTGVRAIYGFAKAFLWRGEALGFSESARRKADKAMARCGLE